MAAHRNRRDRRRPAPAPRWKVGESEIGWGVYDVETGEECPETEHYDSEAEANEAAAYLDRLDRPASARYF